MTDTDFRQLCNTFGFAPSRALRELIDCVRAQEIEACAKVCDDKAKETFSGQCQVWGDYFARAIRARKEKQ